jgi:hypothetical protein
LDKNVAQAYIRRKKRKRRAAIISSVCSFVIGVFILVAFLIMKVDRFTITTLNEPELSLSVDENREVMTTELQAPPLLSATDTQYSDIPNNIEEGVGSKNCRYYFAYSFYLLGKGSAENINYSMSMSLLDISNNIEEAVKVMIIKDGERSIYSKTSKPIYHGTDHLAGPDSVIGETRSYWDDDHIALVWDKIAPGAYVKYTIVIWIDGWESDDSMRAGTFSANLKFSTKLDK